MKLFLQRPVSMPLAVLLPFPRLCAAAALALLACASAWSQTVWENAAMLGMSREQLAPALADARPVRPPRRLSSGAVGSLRIADVLCEGAHFEQTLFFSHDKLQQMELVLLDPPRGGAAAEDAVTQVQAALVQSLRAQLGPELAAFGAAPEVLADSASWVSAGADVMLFRSGTPYHPRLRMVIRQQHLVDASEL